MSNRVQPKQILQEPDVQLNGGFGGLSSASYIDTGDVAYADQMVNCYVTTRNEVKQRCGISSLYSLVGLPLATANSAATFMFAFDGQEYLVVKVGLTIHVFAYGSNKTLIRTITRNNVFSSVSLTEKPSFTTIIEGNTCYVLVATKSTEIVVLVFLRRELVAINTPTSTTITGNISNYPSSNAIIQDNTLLYNTDTKAYIDTTVITQTTSALNITTLSAHGLTSSVNLTIHSYFLCYTRAANYYPGSYLYNSAVRQNSLPLDVNVALPLQIVDNPIINETSIQELDKNSLIVWQTNTTPGFTRVYNQQPTTATQWEFSDGAYTVNPSNFTTRTPSYISFGGLSAGGAVERVYLFRLREILLRPSYLIAVSDIAAYSDLNPITLNFYDSSYTAIASGNARFFSANSTNRPSLSAVVELLHKPGSVTLPGNIVNLDPILPSVDINDNYIIPLYGYSAFSNNKSYKFPDKVLNVGNRVVITGLDNRISVSNSNWTYRGISWNNFQVSTISFNINSAYSVLFGQNVSKINGVESVNGVLIVATNVGVFRVSGDSAFAPPNAQLANISRVSNEIVTDSDNLLIYGNKIFAASTTGVFQLQFNQETQELTQETISTNVGDYFSKQPKTFMYSNSLRSFVIAFANSNELLTYNTESESWSVQKFAFQSLTMSISKTLDGVSFVTNDNVSNNCYMFTKWDTTATTDLANYDTLLFNGVKAIRDNVVLASNLVTIGNSPTNVDALVTPACLLPTLSTNIRLAYGSNHAQSVSGANVQIKDTTDGRHAYDILSYYVSKSFAGDKLIRSYRVRAVNLLVTGVGSLLSAIVMPNKANNSLAFSSCLTVVNSDGSLYESTDTDVRIANGELINVTLRLAGVNESFAIATKITGTVALLAYEFDTSAKKRNRLN